ncbi:MAG: PAAR domain-containing protein [Betaproteobacteria bacterium]|nr:PAAR domain-containing protein [Betaproteobacteria bacterium]
MAQPAARLTDPTLHAAIPIISGSPDTIIGGLLAARLDDLVTPCPVCCTPPPGKIVKASMTVFINDQACARIGDLVACGAGTTPPGGGSHAPVSIYGVKKEDNYVEKAFNDDAFMIEEQAGDPKNPPPPDVQPERKPVSFLNGLSLDLDLGSRSGKKGMGAGPNAIAMGDFTVIVGG